MATQVIGDNVARAFGLVGALSVVRFRTKVKDAQDTTFVIFAVTVGMAAGSNQLPVALVGLLVVFLAARFLWPPRRANTRVEHVEKRLHVRLVPHGDHRAAIEAAIGACAVRSQLLAAAVIEKGKTLDLTYALSVRQDRDVAALVMELSMVDGVVSVELAGDSKK
jgi:uncharacterized membrane protein YhiD involved in acid resistance